MIAWFINYIYEKIGSAFYMNKLKYTNMPREGKHACVQILTALKGNLSPNIDIFALISSWELLICKTGAKRTGIYSPGKTLYKIIIIKGVI